MRRKVGYGNNENATKRGKRWVSPALSFILCGTVFFADEVSAQEEWSIIRKNGFEITQGRSASGAQFSAQNPALPEFLFEAIDCREFDSHCDYRVSLSQPDLSKIHIATLKYGPGFEILQTKIVDTFSESGCSGYLVTIKIAIQNSSMSVQLSKTTRIQPIGNCGEEAGDFTGVAISSWNLGQITLGVKIIEKSTEIPWGNWSRLQ